MWWWKSKGNLELKVDLHSHLVPSVDDGVKSLEETFYILEFYERLGFEKVITTPHIYSEVYPNTEELLEERFSAVSKEKVEKGLDIDIELAAEYFCDVSFLEKIKSDKKLLSFENHVLFETGFLSRPLIFDEVIFELKTRGYIPVLAHPERYQYLEDDFQWLDSLIEKGVLLQLNLPSLLGVYGDKPKAVAKKLLKKSMVTFVGSDLHSKKQLEVFKRVIHKGFNLQNIKNNNFI